MSGRRYAGNGLVVELPAGFAATPEVRQARRRGGRLPTGAIPITTATPTDPLPALLAQGFELVGQPQEIAVGGSAATRRAGTARFTATVAADEDAVVLLEQDGLYSWRFPAGRSEPAAPTGGTRSPLAARTMTREITFEIGLVPSDRGERATTRGPLGSFVFSQVRAVVLKFVARKVTGKVIRHLEAHITPRLVRLSRPDPRSWSPFVPDTSLPTKRPARILLLVHGTFSSTAGGFGGLAGNDAGRALLRQALTQYDLVLGYDHLTLSVDPSENAAELLSMLRAVNWPLPPVIDVITHSRGALVTRSLVEEALPQSAWNGKVDKIVFVGGTNAGTQLAEPGNWARLLDVYTNLAAAAAKLVPEQLIATILAEAIKGLGALAKYLVAYSVDDGGAPGLSAMEPDGDFVTKLNRAQPGQPRAGTTPWYVITSNFEPKRRGPDAPSLPKRLVDALADGLVDQLMREPNDLVVNTASMAAIDTPAGTASGFVHGRFDFAVEAGVFHTAYFQQPETARQLATWLELGPSRSTTRRPGTTGAVRLPGLDVARVEARARAAPPRDSRAETVGGARGHAEPSRRRAAVRRTAPRRAVARQAVVRAYFRAGMPAKAVVGEVTTVRCTVGREVLTALSGASAVAGASVAKDKKITVQVVAKAHGEVVGEDRADIDVPEPGQTSELYFDVRPLAKGRGEIHLIARQGPVPLVTLVLEPTFVLRAPQTVPDNIGAAAEDIPAVAPQTCVKQWLRITERIVGEQTYYDFDLQADDLKVLCQATSAPLANRAEYVAQLYERIENRWLSNGADQKAFGRELRALGGELWDELVPPVIGRALWQNKARLKNVLILSDEPFIPWELVHLKHRRALPKDTWFLGRLGSMRWLQGTYPPDTLSHDKARYVVPDYPEQSGLRLDGTAAEADFVKKQLHGRPIPADSNSVIDALSVPGRVDLLHFAGHGEADAGSARILLAGRIEGDTYVTDSLTDTTIGEFAQLQARNGRRAIVMLNACQAGRLTPKLTRVGGFAESFVRAGAGAFIGALWSVGDQPASTFSQTLYRSLLAGKTLGEASIDARDAAREEGGEATWLAYVVYGNPCARFVRSGR
jgi:hypothetical protein